MAAPQKSRSKIDIEALLSETHRTELQVSFRQRLLDLLDAEEEFVPSASSVLGRLWSLIQSEESSLEECSAVISLDPALTARIFRIANSSVHRANAENVQQAVLHLGMAKLKQIAFNAQIFARFSAIALPAGWEHFWIRNIFVAQLTEKTASFYFRTNGTEYLSGMLHDVGWPLMAAFFPEEFTAVLSNSLPLEQAEKEILSFGHAEISAAVCAKSNFPPRIVNAVLYHHRPMLLESGNFKPVESAAFLGVLLSICDRLADAASLPIGGRVEERDLTHLLELPEVKWLSRFGPLPDFAAMVEKELASAQELCGIFLG